MKTGKLIAIAFPIGLVVVLGVYLFGFYHGQTNQEPAVLGNANAAEAEVSRVLARERDTYYPNSEDLARDEMRVIACGTGMPTTRAAQAAACFLVELGNGDKFLFDIGSGSAERISSLQKARLPGINASTRYLERMQKRR